jgi:hypothetical protein
MKLTIENLEFRVDTIRRQHDDLVAILEFKELKTFYSPEVVKLIALYLPGLEQNVRKMIDDCLRYTETYGHSERLDYVKNVLFNVLGKCVGEDLSDYVFTGREK